MPKKFQLAALQLSIMQVLWERGEATVAEVRQALQEERPLAYTTIATMLSKMERKGQVSHRTEGRVKVFKPAVRKVQVKQSMVTDLARRLFGGDITEMVSHLLDGSHASPEELKRLQQLIRDRERKERGAK